MLFMSYYSTGSYDVSFGICVLVCMDACVYVRKVTREVVLTIIVF